MSKYIIKNCPCYNNERFLSGFLNDNDTFCAYYSRKCQDCTDCVMKQIVKKCRKSLEVSYCPIEQEILELLDIEEVE